MTKKNPLSGISQKTAMMRQLIFCAAALAIIGASAWSLMGQNAPYHPDISNEDVTRIEGTDLSSITD